MSNSKMLIDATHPEETRVVVQRNGRVEEFDFESAARKLLRGNIYLAKVTRVEPSLQAAFVDYGGNRHGFLAFNEIHPDYYQIPVADRQALIEEEAAAEAELEAAADRRAEALARRSSGRPHGGDNRGHGGGGHEPEYAGAPDDSGGEDDASNIIDVEEDEHIEEVGGEAGDDDAPQVLAAAIGKAADRVSEPAPESPHHLADSPHDHHHEHGAEDAQHAGHGDTQHEPHDHGASSADEQAGYEHDAHAGGHDASATDPDSDDDADVGDTEGHASGSDQAEEPRHGRGDTMEEMPSRPRRRPRSYKIQEVIKRRQVILVQVVKEERGNKGAALTTYLSLAGRYTVLMPNTARGGGISRKITQPQDRKRLKAIAQELEVPEGMGLIIRTAGAARTKQEIKRDFEYLLRLWESVRDMTLQSTAPSLVYEEGDLIKRSIRDLYNKDVEEIVVAGDTGFHEARDFMHMLMPSHAENVIHYKEPTPLFTKYGTERQLNAMFLPQVTLRSGGYIVINQTEALVAIDVNSGKSTREFSIEETALATNLEAADEIARQLKLRDLAGLIVIDYIDMEEKRNNRAVERRLKDALRHDRARIQLGRISHFGLMEMSRQRLRTGVLEGSTSQCPHCQGTGIIRSTESIALAVLRGLEDAITAGTPATLVATTTPAVALYILNSKRAYVADMEIRHGYPVTILGSERIQGVNFTIDRGIASALPSRRPERAAVNMNWGFEGEEEDAGAPEAAEITMVPDAGDDDDEAPVNRTERDNGGDSGDGRRGKRRRRRRGGRRGERGDEGPRQDFQPGQEGAVPETDEVETFESNGHAANDDSDGPEGEDSDAPGIEAGGNGDPGDKRGRRRRRGRRGGRRGRDRDGAPLAPEGAPGEAAQVHDGIPMASHPGFEPQPDINAPVQAFGGVLPEGGYTQPRRTERQRPERIWEARTPSQHSEPRGASAEPAPVAEHKAHPAPVTSVVPERTVAPPTPTAEPEIAAPPARPRHETGSSEPRVERVVLKPGETAGDAAEIAAPTQRKGWWQRRFSGE
jgi:ribonuclease E